MSIKLQKLLADQGLGSRRTIESWISTKRIKVNRRVATIGQRVSHADLIEVDGKRIRFKSVATEWLLYHKPEGEVTTRRDNQHRPTVFKKLPRPRHGRWIAVGRLDINSTGLLLFTNNGECAHYLMHPSNLVDRVYMVRVRGMLSQAELKALLSGIDLDGKQQSFMTIQFAGGQSKNFWYQVTLQEGQYREVRRLFSALGHEVGRLMRIQYGGIKLPSHLKRGQYNLASSKDFAFLRQVEQACRKKSHIPY